MLTTIRQFIVTTTVGRLTFIKYTSFHPVRDENLYEFNN